MVTVERSARAHLLRSERQGAALALALVACSGGSAEEDPFAFEGEYRRLNPDLAAGELPYEPCRPEAEAGSFSVLLDRAFSRVEGKVFDRVDPNQIPIEIEALGGCRLLGAPRYLCEPGCAATSEHCGPGGVCSPKPNGSDLGIVRLAGLAAPLALTPGKATKSYSSPAGSLPHPGFAPGADLRLVTGEGEYPRFELRGWGISLLEMPDDPVAVDPASDVQLVWNVPEQSGPARIHVELDINRHGSSSARIECQFEDTGSASIPAALVEGLFERGTSGFPTLLVSRRTATSTAIEPGCVELLVASELVGSPRVAGVRSCNTTAECEPGQTCRPIERFCE